jgi:hypothetical protein
MSNHIFNKDKESAKRFFLAENIRPGMNAAFAYGCAHRDRQVIEFLRRQANECRQHDPLKSKILYDQADRIEYGEHVN